MKYVSPLTILMTLILPLAVSANSSKCPEWTRTISKPMERMYKSERHPIAFGAKLDASSYFWTKGEWFKLPIGYHSAWSMSEYSEIIQDKDRYREWLKTSKYKGYDAKTGDYDPALITKPGVEASFDFWMPDLRYVERNRFWVPSLRPCEAGRPKPGPENYVVNLDIRWPFLPGSADTRTARLFVERTAKTKRGEKLYFQRFNKEENTLDGPISGHKNYTIFSADDQLYVHLDCNENHGGVKLANGSCHGNVWEPLSDLILTVQFPSDRGQRGEKELWREPVEAAISLVKSWRVLEDEQ